MCFNSRTNSNLSKFQKRLLKRLQHDGRTIAVTADKQLGPVAVLLIKYVKDGLVHLKDESTYLILSKEQALAEDSNIQEELRHWMHNYIRVLLKTVTAYI